MNRDLKNGRRRMKRSQWLPPVLLAYFTIMAIFYGPDMIASGEVLRFTLISAGELLVILLLFLFLRKRERDQD